MLILHDPVSSQRVVIAIYSERYRCKAVTISTWLGDQRQDVGWTAICLGAYKPPQTLVVERPESW
jgi:hypothetical protein